MEVILHGLDATLGVLRVVFLGGAIAAAALCAVDWAVRTKRLQPFSPVARTSRRLMNPIIKPVERRVVSAGGSPGSAPLWTLVAIVIAGIIVLQTLEFLLGQLVTARLAAGAGPRGIARLIVSWTFGILYIALLVRVVSSWIRVNPFSRIIRWAFRLTEPMLAPIRGIVPSFGMIDLSPLVAYFGLRIVQWLIMSAL